MDSNQLISLLRYIYPRNLKEARAIMFPLTKREEGLYLDLVRKFVDIYQPKMEKKTGVKLGEVSVLSLREFVRLEAKSFLEEALLEMDSSNFSVEQKKVAKEVLSFGTKILYPLVNLARMYSEDSSAVMSAKKSTISAHFGTFGKLSAVRACNLKFQALSETADTVIHELTHLFWEKIEDSKPHKLGNDERVVGEGFAVYGQFNYFGYINPIQSNENDLCGVYKEGYNRVKRIINYHGEDSYLQIPKRWVEMEQDMKGSL